MAGIITGIIFIITIVFWICMEHHDQKIENKLIEEIERRLTRQVSYRGYYAKIRYSFHENRFYSKIDENIFDEWGNMFKLTEDSKIESEARTEAGALRSFYFKIDSILDNFDEFPFNKERLPEYAEKNNISIDEAKLSMYWELIMYFLKRESSRHCNEH